MFSSRFANRCKLERCCHHSDCGCCFCIPPNLKRKSGFICFRWELTVATRISSWMPARKREFLRLSYCGLHLCVCVYVNIFKPKLPTRMIMAMCMNDSNRHISWSANILSHARHRRNRWRRSLFLWQFLFRFFCMLFVWIFCTNSNDFYAVFPYFFLLFSTPFSRPYRNVTKLTFIFRSILF